jgi:hypothetical protein
VQHVDSGHVREEHASEMTLETGAGVDIELGAAPRPEDRANLWTDQTS